MRFVNSFKAVSLDQLDDMSKTGLHIGRRHVEFISNSSSYDKPLRYVIAFLQYRARD
jgi:hypothetical protein